MFTLTINNMMPTDTGFYYCAIWSYTTVEFGSGVVLSYKGWSTSISYI